MAETLWEARLSPWLRLADVAEADRRAALETAARADARVGRRRPRAAQAGLRPAGRPCPRCGTPIRSRGQGDANRTAYWCPSCQAEPMAQPRSRR